ncbi:hypothetical protein AB0L97_37150 [Nocardia sp. NPDC051911]|uniref:hypothetical protein n=1 Tax=Nocardia sp. NPDC051911 TaxID=3154648 RepID=UPI0034230254
MTNPLRGWQVDPAEITLTGAGLRRPECVLHEPGDDLWAADLRGGVLRIASDGAQQLVLPTNGGGPLADGPDPDIDANHARRSVVAALRHRAVAGRGWGHC